MGRTEGETATSQIKDKIMAAKKLALEKEFGKPLGESLYNYAYGNLPFPEMETINPAYAKKLNRDEGQFASVLAAMKNSGNPIDLVNAERASLRANRILNEKMIAAKVRDLNRRTD
jgi:hypothetical protein